MFRVLMIGDVVGRPGRECLKALLPGLRQELSLDFVVANAENAAGGLGVNERTAEELLAAGADVLTAGDHVWSARGIEKYLEAQPRLLRPANYPAGAPGRGAAVFETTSGRKVGVMNLQGVTFMAPVDLPFAVADQCVDRLRSQTNVILVDFHAEATAEKGALARYLDGRVSAVVGTHTHVPTADERILPQGTGFVTDLGMTGPVESVLGMSVTPAVERFRTRRPAKYTVAEGPVRLCGLLIAIDEETGRATAVSRVFRSYDSEETTRTDS